MRTVRILSCVVALLLPATFATAHHRGGLPPQRLEGAAVLAEPSPEIEAALTQARADFDAAEAAAAEVEAQRVEAERVEAERVEEERVEAEREEAAQAAQAAARRRVAVLSQAPPVVQPAPAPVVTSDVWWSLALCECGGNPGCNTGNGYYGTFQFLLSTWQSVGGTGYPHENGYEEQKLRAQILQARSGWSQWPACSASLGLR